MEHRKRLAKQDVFGDQARPRAESREERTDDDRFDQSQHCPQARLARRPCQRRIGYADEVALVHRQARPCPEKRVFRHEWS